MKLEMVKEILNGRVIVGEEKLEEEVHVGCSADLMSDVLTLAKTQALLLSGLTHVQAVRAATVAEVKAIVYVRGRMPDREAIELGQREGIVLLATERTMYESCGKLYSHGLQGSSEYAESCRDVDRTGVLSKV